MKKYLGINMEVRMFSLENYYEEAKSGDKISNEGLLTYIRSF